MCGEVWSICSFGRKNTDMADMLMNILAYPAQAEMILCSEQGNFFPSCPVSDNLSSCRLVGFLLASGPFMQTHPQSEFTQNNSNHNARLKIHSLHSAPRTLTL